MPRDLGWALRLMSCCGWLVQDQQEGGGDGAAAGPARPSGEEAEALATDLNEEQERVKRLRAELKAARGGQ